MMRAFVLALSFALSSCTVTGKPLELDEETTTLRVERGDFRERLLVSGVLDAAESTNITSPPSAWGAIRWLAEDGQTVKKGDRVLEMDNSAVLSELINLKAQVVTARSQLAQQRNTGLINLAEKQNAVQQADISLRKAKLDAAVPADAYPRRTHEDMLAALTRAQSAYDTAVEELAAENDIAAHALQQQKLSLDKAERALDAARKQLEEYVVVAPRDGLLVLAENWNEGRPFRIGDKPWPGQTIMKIPDLAKMIVKAELSDVDDGRVHVGMEARCVLDAFPDEPIAGRVQSSSPVARVARRRSLRRAFDLLVELDDSDTSNARPGMSVRVEIFGPVQEGVLLAPRQSIVSGKDGEELLLEDGGSRRVELGQCSDLVCVVLAGAEEGLLLRSRGDS